MNTQEAASLATREANPVIDGRKANVNLAYLGAKPRVIPTPTGKNFKNNLFFFYSSKKYRTIIKINHTHIHKKLSSPIINYSTSSIRKESTVS
jgi:hypothetical protein